MNRRLFACGILCFTAVPALAQTNIDSTNKFAWGENVGWINFREAGTPAGNQGVRVGATFLSGFAWGENVGFINFGDGTPTNGVSYANVNNTDFGVNRDPGTGNLTGYAWGENVGWINFSGGGLATPPQPAQVVGNRLTGYAWGENIGWINLTSLEAGKFVSFTASCNAMDIATIGQLAPPYTSDGLLTLSDLDAFFNSFVGLLLRAGGSAPPPQAPGAYYADIAAIGEVAPPYHPDGLITIADLDAGFNLFVSRTGCP